MEDSQIVSLFLDRQETAIAEAAAKYGARLRSLANGIVKDTESARECENDTYLQAWNSIPPHEPREYLFAYLARITRHIALNLCRDRNRLKRNAVILELSVELEQCLPCKDDTEGGVDEVLLQAAINSFLGGLPKEKRMIFLRRYWFSDSIEEIAQRFSLSESKVKITLFRCRNQLREQLRKEGYTP